MRRQLQTRAFERVAPVGKKILGEFPRTQVSLAEAKMGFVSLLRLAFAGGDGLSLTFPRQDKKNAEALAGALREAPIA